MLPVETGYFSSWLTLLRNMNAISSEHVANDSSFSTLSLTGLRWCSHRISSCICSDRFGLLTFVDLPVIRIWNLLRSGDFKLSSWLELVAGSGISPVPLQSQPNIWCVRQSWLPSSWPASENKSFNSSSENLRLLKFCFKSTTVPLSDVFEICRW